MCIQHYLSAGFFKSDFGRGTEKSLIKEFLDGWKVRRFRQRESFVGINRW